MHVVMAAFGAPVAHGHPWAGGLAAGRAEAQPVHHGADYPAPFLVGEGPVTGMVGERQVPDMASRHFCTEQGQAGVYLLAEVSHGGLRQRRAPGHYHVLARGHDVLVAVLLGTPRSEQVTHQAGAAVAPRGLGDHSQPSAGNFARTPSSAAMASWTALAVVS